MSYFQRIKYIATHHGPKAVFAKFSGIAADRWFDWRHGINNDTPVKLDGYTIVGESRKNATSYGASRFLPLRRLFPLLRARGVPAATLTGLINWGRSTWPSGNWNALL